MAAWAIVALASMAASAGLGVEIEVVTEPGVAPTAPQQWAQTLGKLGFDRVRIRGMRSGDKPDITAIDMPTGTRYKLLAILDHNERLVLPGARFGRSDLSKLRAFVERLQQDGLAELNAERGRFGLTTGQLTVVLDELSQTVGFSTKGVPPADVVAKLARRFKLSLELSPQASAILRRGAAAEVELESTSAGTALAMLLRQQRLALMPEKPRGKPLRLSVVPLDFKREVWPVGWKPAAAPRQIVPPMYKFLTIEIDGYTLAEALDALAPRLGVPLWFDQLILTRRNIHPDKISVKLPRGKTYLKRAVDRVLAQAHLAGELRIDEAGHAFYWITQFGKESPRAER